MLKWFDTKGSDDFARSLAKDIEARIPLVSLDGYKRGDAVKHAESLQLVHNRVAKFRQENRLNFYKTAKLGNVLRWELKEAGYPDDFVDQIAKDVVVRLASGASA
jgi:hypothetical protein